MTTLLICTMFYFAIPALGVWITGRKFVWKGWLVMLFLWPVAWMFMGPEELP